MAQISSENIESEIPPIYSQTIEDACWDSVISSRILFSNQQSAATPEFYEALKLKLNTKVFSEYQFLNQKKTDEIALQIHQQAVIMQMSQKQTVDLAPAEEIKEEKETIEKVEVQSHIEQVLNDLPKETAERLSRLPKQFIQFQEQTANNPIAENTYIPNENATNKPFAKDSQLVVYDSNPEKKQLSVIQPARLGTVMLSKIKKVLKPQWHRPWKLMRVISGHHGWVRSLAIDPANQFFVTGSSDRTIKFWDMATGSLKITYTGHISAVRGLVVSAKHPYLFSCGEDKTVKCWDLEQNKIIRDYHGHLSGVYSITQHPTLDLIATGGRDSVVRVWDIRTRTQVHVLEGHSGTIDSVISQEFEPQIVSGSQDSMIKLWDLATGRTIATLTNHKKSVRALTFHPLEYTFVSASPDNIKVWKCPEGQYLRNISGHNAIINTIAINKENVLVSAADNGSMFLWDYKTGYNFQQIQGVPQPGSIAAENGIFCSAFDQSQMRLITGECDKTIKMYKEDEEATPETHPIDDFKLEFQTQKF